MEVDGLMIMWQLGPVVFKWLPQRIGGYQNLNPHGGQILLNLPHEPAG